MEERYYEVDDLPISVVDHKALSWGDGVTPRPYSWVEVFVKGTQISRQEFDDRCAVSAELAATLRQ